MAANADMGNTKSQTESIMKTRTTSRTYQLGASHERQAFVAYLRRLRCADKTPGDPITMLDMITEWVARRVARFSAKPGGLGRTRKAKSVSGKIKSAFGCKVPNV